MKIRQNIRHFATKEALTMPIIGDIATEKMVNSRVRIFSERTDPDHRGEREDHIAVFFECTSDAYLAALDAGFPEAEAHEITHVQANFGFYNHGWIEMMEIPAGETEVHYKRCEEFFECHGIDITKPLDKLRTADIPGVPAMLNKFDDPGHPRAEGGFADDMYVEGDSGEVGVDGADKSEDMDVSATSGMQDADRTDERTA